MPTETEHDWETIAARVGLVPEGLSSLQAAYDEGVAQGLVAAAAPGRRLRAAGRGVVGHRRRASTRRSS